MLKVIIITTLVCLAAAQLKSTTEIDAKITLNYQSLLGMEANIVASVSDYITALNKTALAEKSIPAVYTALNDLVTYLRNLKTISSYSAPSSTVTCDDVNSKIIHLEFNVRRYKAISGECAANMTRLNQAITVVTRAYLSNKKAADTASADLYSLILKNKIPSLFMDYISLLSKVSTDEQKISTNLNTYKSLYCTCPSAISSAGASKVSTLEDNIKKVEDALKVSQTTIQNATKDAKDKVVATNAMVSRTTLNTNLQKISDLCTTYGGVDDYANYTLNVTTCLELAKRSANIQYRVDGYRVIVSKISTVILPTIAKASASINSSLIAYNSTYNTTQRASIKLSITATTNLQVLYTNYKSDLGYSRDKMVKMLAEIKSVKDSYCMCKGGNLTTTTTTDAATTTTVEEGELTTTTTADTTVETTEEVTP